MPEEYEILVVGSGEAGKYLAWTMAKEGRRTALVERKLVGGSCPNTACLPSKNVIHSAKIAAFARRAPEFGLDGGPLTTSMKGVFHRKQEMVDGLSNCISSGLKQVALSSSWVTLISLANESWRCA